MGLGFKHPGDAFMDSYPMPRTVDEFEQTVQAYGEFLISRTGLSGHPPIDLQAISEHFGIALKAMPLGDHRDGFAIEGLGTVVVNSDSPVVRQRFTRAHELLEFLFFTIANRHPSQRIRDLLTGPKKEWLCDRGASWLLLPRTKLAPEVQRLGLTLDTASAIASQYDTSFTATLIAMLDHVSERQLVVVWRNALKPKQERRMRRPEELVLHEMFETQPVKKMRVWWSAQSRSLSDRFIPQHLSVEDNPVIAEAYVTASPASGIEYIDFVTVKGRFHVEARPVTICDERCVIALLSAV